MPNDVMAYSGPLIMVFVVSVLIATMPLSLLAAGTQTYAPNIPQFFQGSQLGRYENTYNVTIDIDDFDKVGSTDVYQQAFSLGDESFYLFVNETYEFIQVGKTVYGYIFGVLPVFTGYDFIEFTNVKGQARGTIISLTEMDADYVLSSTQSVIQYSGLTQDSAIRVDIYLGWNQSVYNVPSEAIRDETMIFLGASGLNRTLTAVSGLEILLGLLTWQIPNVPYPVNLLLSGVFYIPLVIVGIKLASDLLPW